MDHSMIFSTFKSAGIEEHYRNTNLKDDKFHSIIVIGLLCLIHLSLLSVDYSFTQSDHSEFKTLLNFRLSSIAVSILTMWIIYKAKFYKIFDWTLFSWTLFQILIIYLTIQQRPQNFLIHSVNDILFYTAIYMLLPHPLIFQAVGGTVYTAVLVYINLFLKTFQYTQEKTLILVAFILANAIGFFVSWRIHSFRRKKYEIWLQEKQTKERYMSALDEIKTLKGIIPICSECKSIRDDQGYWSEVEEYLAKTHDEVEFSHGLCPECHEKARLQMKKDLKTLNTIRQVDK